MDAQPEAGQRLVEQDRVLAVGRALDAASRDRPGAANRAFEILRAVMNRAEE